MRLNVSHFKDKGLNYSGSVTSPFQYEPPVDIGTGTAIFSDVTIGSHSYINGGTIRDRVRIGRYCSIAIGVVLGAPNHSIDLISTHPFATKCSFDNSYGRPFRSDEEKSRETRIGNDVWVGVNAIIIEGVTIGTGAVIAAGAVVVKDVPPYAIVGGVPARVLRYRFPNELIALLLKSEWWLYPSNFLETLPTNNIFECIKRCEAAEELKKQPFYIGI